MICADITSIDDVTSERTKVAHVVISKDGPGIPSLAMYDYTYAVTDGKNETRTGRIERFYRGHSAYGAVRLVAEVLKKAFPFLPQNKHALAPNENLGETEKV